MFAGSASATTSSIPSLRTRRAATPPPPRSRTRAPTRPAERVAQLDLARRGPVEPGIADQRPRGLLDHRPERVAVAELVSVVVLQQPPRDARCRPSAPSPRSASPRDPSTSRCTIATSRARTGAAAGAASRADPRLGSTSRVRCVPWGSCAARVPAAVRRPGGVRSSATGWCRSRSRSRCSSSAARRPRSASCSPAGRCRWCDAADRRRRRRPRLAARGDGRRRPRRGSSRRA